MFDAVAPAEHGSRFHEKNYTWNVRKLLLSLALLFATSCGSGTSTYVGTVQGGSVAVGMVSDGNNVALFFCGSLGQQSTTTKWLRFSESNGTFVASKDTWKVSGSTSGTTVTGTLDRGDGQTVTWTASRVADGDVAGLYESDSAAGTAGVVVLNATAAQGALIDPQQNIEQIIPIFPLQITNQGLHVTVGTSDTFVPRLATP